MSISHTYINNKIDIPRLLDIVEHGYRGRGCGLTFATVMLMVGEAELGDPGNLYLYIGENEQICQYVRRELVNILTYIGIPIHTESRRNEVALANGLTFRFVSASLPTESCWQAIAGYSFHRVFVDLTPESRHGHGYELVMRAKSRERV